VGLRHRAEAPRGFDAKRTPRSPWRWDRHRHRGRVVATRGRCRAGEPGRPTYRGRTRASARLATHRVPAHQAGRPLRCGGSAGPGHDGRGSQAARTPGIRSAARRVGRNRRGRRRRLKRPGPSCPPTFAPGSSRPCARSRWPRASREHAAGPSRWLLDSWSPLGFSWPSLCQPPADVRSHTSRLSYSCGRPSRSWRHGPGWVGEARCWVVRRVGSSRPPS